MNTQRYGLLVSGAAALALAAPAMAQDMDAGGDARHQLEVRAKDREYSDDNGALRSLTLEYKLDYGDVTLLLAPAIGEREITGGDSVEALRGTATLYVDIADGVASRTSASFAEDEPVFAQLDVAQEVSFAAFDSTLLTLGARYAEYFGDVGVTFLSIGGRHYFRGGSVSYRLSRIDPEGTDGFFAHLVNVAIKDGGTSTGETQLWLSKGASALDRDPLLADFSGDDYGGYLRRVQPLGGKVALLAGIGITSYDRPGGRISGTDFGLGLRLSLD